MQSQSNMSTSSSFTNARNWRVQTYKRLTFTASFNPFIWVSAISRLICSSVFKRIVSAQRTRSASRWRNCLQADTMTELQLQIILASHECYSEHPWQKTVLINLFPCMLITKLLPSPTSRYETQMTSKVTTKMNAGSRVKRARSCHTQKMTTVDRESLLLVKYCDNYSNVWKENFIYNSHQLKNLLGQFELKFVHSAPDAAAKLHPCIEALLVSTRSLCPLTPNNKFCHSISLGGISF